MNDFPLSNADGVSDLDLIDTRWSDVHDSTQFMARYGRAIRRYLEAILKNSQDAEDVAQSFFLRIVERGFENADPGRGRFRDYVKIGVRNAALSFLRKQKHKPLALDDDAVVRALAQAESNANRQWLRDWQSALLERAWHALDRHQRVIAGNLFHTVLRVSVSHPEDDSTALAARVSKLAGRTLSADAFRKQLSRARRLFAEALVREVSRTLKNPSAGDIEDELKATGLRAYVQRYLSQ